MSFRGDNQRYGHLPPVQYPVPGRGQNAYPPQSGNYDENDDAVVDDGARHQGAVDTGREAEMFMTSPTSSTGQYQQHPQQTPLSPSTYNPQHFAVRSNSTSLPYHPAANRYASPLPTNPTSYTPQPASYAPPTYDPSAYAGVSPPQQYNQFGHGYGAGQTPVAPYHQTVNPPYSPTYSQDVVSPPHNSQYAPSLPSPQQYSTHSTPSISAAPFQQTWAGPSQPSNGSAAHAPYPPAYQMPVGPNYSTADPNAAFINSRQRADSRTPPAPSPPVHQSASPQLGRHPTNRPLPHRPPPSFSRQSEGESALHDYLTLEENTQDDLMQDILGELGQSGSTSRPAPINGNISDDDLNSLRHSDSRASTLQGTASSHVPSRYASNASTLHSNNNSHGLGTFYTGDDDSDGEANYGLAMMQEDEDADRRFSGNAAFSSLYPSHTPTAISNLRPPPEEQPSGSDSEYAGGMDIGAFSGGYAPNLSYDNNTSTPPARSTSLQNRDRPLPPPPTDQNPPYPDDDSDDGDYYGLSVNVDYGDTGGLQAPTEKRRSFDEGDDRASGSESPTKEDMPDLFFHPGLSNRPLPALPTGSDTSSLLSVQSPSRQPFSHSYSLSADSRMARGDGFDPNQPPLTAQQQVERSISLSSHTTTPTVQLPGRSRTDAAEERKRALRQQQQHSGSQLGTPLEGYATPNPSTVGYDLITLPVGRKKRFIPEKLTVADCRRCVSPWALSSLASWLREMAEGEPDLKRKAIEEGLTKLFTTKVPTMNIADAEALGAMVVDRLYEAGIVIEDEEWAKFGPGSVSGVLWQMTGSGCYAPKLHETEISGRCYSYHCTRTLKKANVDDLMAEEPTQHHADWATFHKLDKAAVEGKPKKEVERQNILHEIITGEEDYMGQLDVVRVLYRDQLRAWAPPIIPPARINNFVDRVFGKIDGVHSVNKEYLLAQLKYRQNEQGPWIVGFSDIFRDWIRKAEVAYLEFSAAFPLAQLAIRKEAARNVLFAQFLEHIQRHKRSNRLGWDTFLKAPITRLQRYSLLLDASLKKMVQDSEEKTNLIKALEEIRTVTHKCDEAVARSKSKVDLHILQSALVLRPGFQSVLNLDHLGRQLIHRGDLTRMGSKGVRWVDTHALLFDHYFILAKEYPSKDGKDKKYDVSKEVSFLQKTPGETSRNILTFCSLFPCHYSS